MFDDQQQARNSNTQVNDQSAEPVTTPNTIQPNPTVSADSTIPPADSVQPSLEPDRPDSTKTADSPPAEPESKPSLPDQPVEETKQTSDEPPQPTLPNLADSPQSSQSGRLNEPIISPPEISSPSATPSPSPITPSNTPSPSEPDLSNQSNISTLPQESPTNTVLSDNNAPQVQQEASRDTPLSEPIKPVEESAENKPESPEQPTTPSTPPENIPPKPPSPKVGFGDLLNKTKVSEPAVSPSSPPVQQSATDVVTSPEPAEEKPVIPPPLSTQPTPTPSVINQNEIGKKVDEKIKARLTFLQQKGNQKKREKKQAMLQRIVEIARTKGKINNQEAQKILHLPQSTLTDYFKELVSQGTFKREGKGKATYYHL